MKITMSKDGTIVIPVEVRGQINMLKGGELRLSVGANGLFLFDEDGEPFKGEIYTPERKAQLLLNNAMTKEEWDEIVFLLLREGIDAESFPSIDISARESLPALV